MKNEKSPMTPAQNRALRSVLLSHLRHLDRFVMYLETAPGVNFATSVFGGIRTHITYNRATVRAAIQQLEDQHENTSSKTGSRGKRIQKPTPQQPNNRVA